MLAAGSGSTRVDVKPGGITSGSKPAPTPPGLVGFRNLKDSGWLVSTGVADALEGTFNELFALFADVVIDSGHRLDRACSRAGEGEFAIGDFALVEGEGAIAEDDEAAVGEFATFVFMEIENDFFVGKRVFGDFHLIILEVSI